MGNYLFSDRGDVLSSALPNDTAAQAGGAGPAAATVKASGNLGLVAAAGGTAPASTGGDIVVGVINVPANAFDVAGRMLDVFACGSFAANGNTKTVKLIAGATSPTVGQAVSGGTTIATTGAVTTNGAGWSLSATIIKTGANGSNTQSAINGAAQCGAASAALTNPQSLTLTENATIPIAVTINAATTASDAKLWMFQADWFN
jgi:hypothetical protein